MHLFYSPDVEKFTELPEEESKHCTRVLRLRPGTEVRLTDGKGFFYSAVIQSATAHSCVVEVLESVPSPAQGYNHLHIAVAPTKNMDRMEWMTEKLTEVGIGELSLLRCQCSERKEIKTGRLEKIMISAMKQSLKACLPKLNEITKFADFVSQPFDGQKYIAHCHQDEKVELADVLNPSTDTRIIIGPEGDFTAEEIELALANDYKPVGLGPSRLRTETAALAACFTFHFNWNLHK